MDILVYSLIFLYGISIGSFLNVLIYRLPRGLKFTGGRSKCPHCQHTLAWFELVPIISYLALGGKCRHCNAEICPRYPIIEMITGIGFITLYAVFGLSLAYGLSLLLFIGGITLLGIKIFD